MDFSEEELDYDETGLEEDESSPPRSPAKTITGPPKKKKVRSCPICDKGTTQHVRRHVIREHLPWYVLPDQHCRDCRITREPVTALIHAVSGHCKPKGRREHEPAPRGKASSVWAHLMNGLLRQLCLWLRVPNLQTLLTCYLVQSLHSGPPPPIDNISEMEDYLVRTFIEENSLGPCPSILSLSSPNHVGMLVHWRIITALVKCLSPLQQIQVRDFSMLVDEVGQREVEVFRSEDPDHLAADSHFHLDSLLCRAKVASLDAVPHDYRNSCQVDLDVAISNFCWLGTRPSPRLLRQPEYMDPRLHFTVGLHPLMADRVTESDLQEYQDCLKLNRVVGAGEMGLDYHQRSDRPLPSPKRQQWLLERLVSPLSTADLPVVIHCRDQAGSSQASQDVLRILQKTLPSQTRIHYHCFMGTVKDMTQWLQAFPNTYFGFTPKILFSKVDQVQEVLAEIQLGNVLLESDAPYILPPNVSRFVRFGSPWAVGMVAERIARLKRVSLGSVLQITLQNCRSLYRV